MPGLPIGPLELILILAIALLIIGPGKLPEVGSAFGRTIREFRKASTEAQESMSLSSERDAKPVPTGPTLSTNPPSVPGQSELEPAVSPSPGRPPTATPIDPPTPDADPSPGTRPQPRGTPAAPVADQS